MSCQICHRKVIDSSLKRNIWICKCGGCNLCHPNGIYRNYDDIRMPHKFLRKGVHDNLKPLVILPHPSVKKWIPDIERVHPFLLEEKKKKINRKELLAMNYLIQKQQGYLPSAIKELQDYGYKVSHWAWWAFPTDKAGNSEPSPKTYLTKETVLIYLQSPPLKWKQLLQQIVKILHKNKTTVSKIFPKIDHGRIVAFVDFFKGVISKKNKKLTWLENAISEIDNNFY